MTDDLRRARRDLSGALARYGIALGEATFSKTDDLCLAARVQEERALIVTMLDLIGASPRVPAAKGTLLIDARRDDDGE